MIKHIFKRVGYWGPLLLILAISLLIYFNRSYAYIYNHIDKMALKIPDRGNSYLVVNNKAASSSLVYAALGDSLTAGVGANQESETYPYILAQYLAGNDYQVTLMSRAVPGVKTKEILASLLSAAIQDEPDVVTLLIGVNDIHGEIGKATFKKNYDRILERLTSETKAKIYVINIPYIGADNLLLPPYNYIFDYKTKQFNKIILELTQKYKVNYIDLYTQTHDLFKEPGSHYAADLFHPSAQGYKIWADLIYADISK